MIWLIYMYLLYMKKSPIILVYKHAKDASNSFSRYVNLVRKALFIFNKQLKWWEHVSGQFLQISEISNEEEFTEGKFCYLVISEEAVEGHLSDAFRAHDEAQG